MWACILDLDSSPEGLWLHVYRVLEGESHLLQRLALGPREALRVAPQLGGLEIGPEELVLRARRGEQKHLGELHGEEQAVGKGFEALGLGRFVPSGLPRSHECLRQERLAP